MNKPILALFSLLFIASASCIPLNLPEEDFAPASRSINAPRATPATTFRTPASTIKDQTGRQANKMLELVEDDDDFLDDDLGDNFDNDEEKDYAPPSASISNKPTAAKSTGGFKATSGTGLTQNSDCYQNCKKNVPNICLKVSKERYEQLSQDNKTTCIKYCTLFEPCTW